MTKDIEKFAKWLVDGVSIGYFGSEEEVFAFIDEHFDLPIAAKEEYIAQSFDLRNTETKRLHRLYNDNLSISEGYPKFFQEHATIVRLAIEDEWRRRDELAGVGGIR